MDNPGVDEGSDSTPSSTTHSHADTTATSIKSDASPNLQNGPPKENSVEDRVAPNGINDGQPTAEARKPGILYRVEYRYDDGEIAYEKEGADEANLLVHRFTPVDALPPLTITTVYYSPTTREQSKRRKKDKAKTKEDDEKKGDEKKGTPEDKKDVSSEKGEDDSLEDFAESHAAPTKCMTIYSRKLLNALRDVVAYYPGETLLGDEIKFYEPYRLLCHHIEELRAYKNNQPEWHDEAYRQECSEHIDILLKYFDDRYGKALNDERARWARPNPVCTFEYLWLLLKPGEACYRIRDGQTNPCITQQVSSYSGLVQKKAVKYVIDAWNIDFDGYYVGRCMYCIWIPPFDGEKEIKSLVYFPIRFGESQASIERNRGKTFYQTLVTRGKKFWDLAKRGNCYQEYSGESADYPHKKIQGRVVVDPRSYFGRYDFETSNRGTAEECPTIMDDGSENDDDQKFEVSTTAGCQCYSCASHGKVRHDKFEGFSRLDPDVNEPPDDETFFFLCDQRVFAFILKSRTWETLYVDDVVDVEEQEHAFRHLVLPYYVKHTLKAISCSYVKAQKNSRTQHTDIIKGKGEGKIFLLHGPPGTGKTLSAEVVAELTKRPLLSLTCGDLGTTAEEVELRLGRYMSLRETWGAVVLLDEADIYLEARAINEVKRNSLVSVFLRALEYYKGLLFLTTNRVSTFDEAFKSRIHVALEYKRLTDNNRQEIWKNNMDKMESPRIKVTETAREYAYGDDEVRDLKWNGREIRNAIQTAMSLAEFEAEEKAKDIVTIKSTHLKKIVAISASFQRYIASMHRNKSDSHVALQKRLRNDFYRDTPYKTPDKSTAWKSKYSIPEDDQEAPATETIGRYGRKVLDEEDEDQRPKTQKVSVKKSTRAISEDEGDSPRSRSKQANGRSRHIATIEEEFEDEAPEAQRSSRRNPRVEEASEEEAPKPKRSSRRVLHEEEEDESEELQIPKAKEMARRPSKQGNWDQEDKEEPPRAAKLTRKHTKTITAAEEEEEPSPRLTKPAKRASTIIRDDDRYDRTGSQSPARAKKGVARKVNRYPSESEEE